nr:hypothetical protein [Tanacetum cinerariifolium]
MKMDWVPYVPFGKRSALVERLKSQIFVLSCVQRRAGLKHLKEERVAESALVERLKSQIFVLSCVQRRKNVSQSLLTAYHEYTNNLIAAEELSEDQKDAFKEFLKEKVQERKRANREARQKRKQALEELSQEKLDAINNTRVYKFYPLEAPDNTVMLKLVEAIGKILIGVVCL